MQTGGRLGDLDLASGIQGLSKLGRLLHLSELPFLPLSMWVTLRPPCPLLGGLVVITGELLTWRSESLVTDD